MQNRKNIKPQKFTKNRKNYKKNKKFKKIHKFLKKKCKKCKKPQIFEKKCKKSQKNAKNRKFLKKNAKNRKKMQKNAKKWPKIEKKVTRKFLGFFLFLIYIDPASPYRLDLLLDPSHPQPRWEGYDIILYFYYTGYRLFTFLLFFSSRQLRIWQYRVLHFTLQVSRVRFARISCLNLSLEP